MFRSPRMTIRRWMVLVSFVGILFWSGRIYEHWRRCEWKAYQHADEARFEFYCASPDYKDGVCGMAAHSAESDEEGALRRTRRRASALRAAGYHLHLKRKFERAAWRPWEAFPRNPFDLPEH
jgi:hypothetical protein